MFRCWPMPARMGDSAPFSAPYVKLWLLCRTPLCAPRFAFHVHAFQTRSFRCFPFCGDFPVGSSGASPFVKIPSSAAPLFPVSEAAPACASALHPRTIPCAPRFAFHVHAFQTRSFRRFPFCGDFPVGSSGAFLSMKIPSPPAPCFPVSEAAPACASALRPRTILCAPCFAFPCSCFSSKFSPGAFPSAEISPSVHLALPLCEDSPAARPAFPVSEATPACASALRPWTIPCAPRFAFHVHTSQANSLPSDRPA